MALARLNARNMFYAATVSMGWQLAVTVLVPVFIGVKLDDHFNSAPSYTLAALFIAAGGACYVVWKTIKQVGQNSSAKGSKS